MDEEKGIGNIIFYVIAAIIAIVSSIKKKKNLPEGAGDMPQREKKPGGFPDDMFDDDEEPVYQEEYQEEYRAEPVRQPIPVPVYSAAEGTYEEPLAPKFSGEGVSSLDHIETERRFEELLRETATIYDTKEAEIYDYDTVDDGEFTLVEEFDARKAVIWSEIIARREY